MNCEREKQDKTILVVEDELPLQKAIKLKLEKCGFLTLTARSVEQAINHLKDVEGIDVVWLDHYLLGKETGLEFVEKLKNNKKWKNIPIFIVTNTAGPNKIKTYLRLGVTKYYTKSDCRLEEVINDIRDFLDKE